MVIEHGSIDMIKRICFFVVLFTLSSVSIACPRATPTNSPNFCPTFRIAAQCHCKESGLPAGMCKNLTLLYQRLISVFGGLDKACEFQHDTTKEDCMDSWNCYLHGGKNATGNLCSGTGRACL